MTAVEGPFLAARPGWMRRHRTHTVKLIMSVTGRAHLPYIFLIPVLVYASGASSLYLRTRVLLLDPSEKHHHSATGGIPLKYKRIRGKG